MKKDETKKIMPVTKLDDKDLDQVSGGSMLFGKTCKYCGGVINNDPNFPDDLRCQCGGE